MEKARVQRQNIPLIHTFLYLFIVFFSIPVLLDIIMLFEINFPFPVQLNTSTSLNLIKDIRNTVIIHSNLY